MHGALHTTLSYAVLRSERIAHHTELQLHLDRLAALYDAEG